MHWFFALNDNNEMPSVLSDQTTEQKAHSYVIKCKSFAEWKAIIEPENGVWKSRALPVQYHTL